MGAGTGSLRLRIIALYATGIAGLGALVLLVPFATHTVAPRTTTVQARADREESEGLSEAVQARIDRIKADLAHGAVQSWEGEFYEGDGLGFNLNLYVSAKSGVAATFSSDVGLPVGHTGAIRTNADGSLHFVYNKLDVATTEIYPELVIPVRWGERHYLMSPSKIPDFVDMINRGWEPRVYPQGGPFLLARGDELKHVDGLPLLPGRYAEKIRDQPLTGTVVEEQPLSGTSNHMGEMCDKSYRLKLEVSGSGRLEKGDVFWSEAPGRAYGSLVVESVESQTVVGVAKILESNCMKPEAVPDRSWTFSTGAYDPLAANHKIDAVRSERSR